MSTTESYPALAHRCPFCSSEPGEPCRTHRGRGTETVLHSRRIALTVTAAGAPRQPAAHVPALCCVCGTQRTVSADYSRNRDPNHASSVQGRKAGWRYTQTLKCDGCGQPTRHALLRPGGSWQDIDEAYQRYVLGGEWDGQYPPDRDRLRAEYFAQFPRNPMLRHRFYVERADKLRAEGETHMQAACGATCEIPQSWNTADIGRDELSEPARIDWDTEVEDNDTGMWWLDMDCVDCLRVTNTLQLKRLRKLLLTDLLEMSNAVDSLDAVQVGELREHLARLMDAARTT